MLAIFKREFNSYFTNPMGYVFLAVFYFFSGMYFSITLKYNSTDITIVFSYLFEVLMFIIPLLCMRLMSEEKRQKTDQLLLTSPVSITGLVLGKFLAAFAIYAMALAVTVVYSIILSFFAAPEWAVIVGNIFGSLIMGAAMISICLLISACTESQIIAAIGGLAAMLLLWMVENVATLLPESFAWLGNILSQLSFSSRYDNFCSGILNIGDVLFYISAVVVFLFFNVRVIEKRRWS